MLRDRGQTEPGFGRLLRHPARKRSQPRSPHWAPWRGFALSGGGGGSSFIGERRERQALVN